MSTAITGENGRSAILRIVTRAAAAFMALLLIAAVALPVVDRASADHGPLEAIFGTAIEVEIPDSVTVATDSGVKTILIPGDDVFTGDITTLEDVSEGDRIVGSVHVETDGTITAEKLLVVPDLSRTITRHILGVILEIGDGVVIVQDRDSNTISVDVPEGIGVPPAGTVVTAVAQLNRATGRLSVHAFDRVEDAVQRIQDATDRANDPELKDRLENLLERARDQHLSALERAREGLQRAQEAVSAAIAERDAARQRLSEVEANFDLLRQRYIQEANDRNERLPELRTEGTLIFDDHEWQQQEGTFSLVPRNRSFDDGVVRDFNWTQHTLAIVPVELRETDPELPAFTAAVAHSIALPLNDVKSLIPSGSKVVVQYDPNTDPAQATLITVLPPELPDAIRDALERERLRSVNGFITLVEETPGLDTAIGVVVVANREHDLNVAVKVTDVTEIEINGKLGELAQLAAGMSVEIEFDATSTDTLPESANGIVGRLNALRIRASSEVDNDEIHVAGLISGIDIDTRTIGILTRNGDIVRAQVVDDAAIVKDGTPARFTSLEVGDLVLDASRFNRGTLVLTRLAVQSAETARFSGTVTGIDYDPDRLSIATDNGRVLSVLIADSTELKTVDGRMINFEDLTVGHGVIRAEAQPVQRGGSTVLVALEMVIGRSEITTARGVVRRVNAETGEIQIEVPASTVGQAPQHILLKVAENNRSIMFKNDVRIRSLSSVFPSEIVESVSYVTDSRVILRLSVVSRDLQRARGTVSAVTATGLTLETSTGPTVGLAITGETVLTLNGRKIDSTHLIKRGDIVVEAVYISSADNPARGAALRITLISPIRSDGSITVIGADGRPIAFNVETTVAGIIEEISDDEWKIGERKFDVTSETRFFGERPQVGLVAKATLILDEDGDFVATAISVAGRPDTNPSTRPVEIQPVQPGDTPDIVRILGHVNKIVKSDTGQTVIVIDGAKVSLVDSTIVVGNPEEEALALAVVRRTPGGTIVAVTIVFTNVDDTSFTAVPVLETDDAEHHEDPDVPSDEDNSGSGKSDFDDSSPDEPDEADTSLRLAVSTGLIDG